MPTKTSAFLKLTMWTFFACKSFCQCAVRWAKHERRLPTKTIFLLRFLSSFAAKKLSIREIRPAVPLQERIAHFRQDSESSNLPKKSSSQNFRQGKFRLRCLRSPVQITLPYLRASAPLSAGKSSSPPCPLAPTPLPSLHPFFNAKSQSRKAAKPQKSFYPSLRLCVLASLR